MDIQDLLSRHRQVATARDLPGNPNGLSYPYSRVQDSHFTYKASSPSAHLPFVRALRLQVYSELSKVSCFVYLSTTDGSLTQLPGKWKSGLALCLSRGIHSGVVRPSPNRVSPFTNAHCRSVSLLIRSQVQRLNYQAHRSVPKRGALVYAPQILYTYFHYDARIHSILISNIYDLCFDDPVRFPSIHPRLS